MRTRSIFSLFLAIATLTACGERKQITNIDVNVGGGNYPPVPVSLFVSPDSIRIPKGSSYQLSVVVTAPSGQSTAINWLSNSTDIASVSSSGLITGNSEGFTLVIASAVADASKKDTVKVVVYPPLPVPMVRSISISPLRMDLNIGQSSNALVTVVADSGITTTFHCVSTNAAIVTAVFLAPSSCKITATAVNPAGANTPVKVYAETDAVHPTLGKLRAEIDIYIIPPPVPVSIRVLPDSVDIFKGTTLQLAGTVTVPQGQSTGITWRSLNPSTATVSSTGLVTGVNVGVARIVGIANADTTKRDTSKVVVNTPPQVRSISITPLRMDLKVGQSLDAVVTVVADPGVSTGFHCVSTNAALVTAVFVAPSSCRIKAIDVNPFATNFPIQIYAETDAVHPTLGKLKAGLNVFVTPP